MFTITKLKMWMDPKYTRQCVEIPPAGSLRLPAPDYASSEPLRPRRGSTLTALELPLSYIAVHNMSYLYLEAEDSRTPVPNTMKVFGWIISIEEIASSNDAVRITWMPDYWRTYSQYAVYGSGTVTRCANETYKRPYQAQPRMMLVDDYANLCGQNPSFLLMRTLTDSDGDITSFEYYFDELNLDDGVNRTPTTEEMFSGKVDELLEVTPESIVGCWIVPFDLSSFFYGVSIVVTSNNITYHKSQQPNDALLTKTISATDGHYKSDDMYQTVTLDPYGNIESVLPWGFSLNKSVKIAIDISVNGVTMYIFNGNENINADDITNGNYLAVRGLDVPINSNAWSEYAFTYQRSYDKRMAEIQRNQQAVAGYAGTTQSIIGGAIAGATKGSVTGALGGAIAGGISSIIGTTVGYFTQGYFNDELQKETDKLVSNQNSTVLKSGGGVGWISLSGGSYSSWRIALLKADAVSLAEYTAHITKDGYSVEIPVGNASSFITAGGPLQIQNLVVTGAIPPEAKTYIKNILSNGVRIVENNPTGTDPGEESP